jgi:hypothetical protein
MADGIAERSRRADAVMMLCRNTMRRSLLWKIVEGYVMPVAAGDTFLIHDVDLDQPGLAAAFEAMIEAKVITIEATDVIPTLH